VVEVCATSFLWCYWLQQEMSSIAIYMRRSLNVYELLLTLVAVTTFLALVAYWRGEKVQTIVEQKYNTKNLNECCLIDFSYGCVLAYFKHINKLPMSTTWAFLGLLGGREVGIALTDFTCDRLTHAVFLLSKDLIMAGIGLGISIGMLLMQNPN
jgi:hypothetical protein